jgi:integrase
LGLAGKPIAVITTQQIDTFQAKRRTEQGRKPKSKVSPATLNKDLRHIKAALRFAVDRGFLRKMPTIEFEREPEKLPTYVTPEDFSSIYDACSAATLPAECPGGAKLWWQALLVFAQMTGWRIGEILALKWNDVDLQKCTAVTRHGDNKGKRDELVPLHPFVIEHMQKIRAFHPNVFPWEHHRRTLDAEFAAIQDAAGINLQCPDTGKRNGEKYAVTDVHECTGACHRYSFHDERRSFATLNAGLPAMTLQKLMRHRHHSTTIRYINMAAQLHPAMASLHVPAVSRSGQTG